jgi:hypothetical protein
MGILLDETGLDPVTGEGDERRWVGGICEDCAADCAGIDEGFMRFGVGREGVVILLGRRGLERKRILGIGEHGRRFGRG